MISFFLYVLRIKNSQSAINFEIQTSQKKKRVRNKRKREILGANFNAFYFKIGEV